VELLDFDIMMSPKDVFAFDLYQNASGQVEFTSCDTKTLIRSGFVPNYDRDGDGTEDCYILSTSTFGVLGLVTTCDETLTEAQALTQAKKGYVEIIGEGSIFACSSNKNNCASACTGDGAVTIGVTNPLEAKLLLNSQSALSLYDKCNADITDVTTELVGRVYHGVIKNGAVEALAHVNAEAVHGGAYYHDAQPILHYEDDVAEATAIKCAGADGQSFTTFWAGTWTEPCYFYGEVQKGDTATGAADDLNNCYYKASIDDPNDVANKYGAAATYGPTLLDTVDSIRTGTVAQARYTVRELTNNGGGMANASTAWEGLNWDGYAVYKDYVDSHFIAAPGLINTAFVFVFPLQHFIGERDVISGPAFYDMEENTKITGGKFLSPGLPTTTAPSEEAFFTTFTSPPFTEGWLRFTLKDLTVNATSNCTETTSAQSASCVMDPNGQSSPGILNKYTPAYTGLVLMYSPSDLSASSFIYNTSLDFTAGNEPDADSNTP
jgi:hypothetical protein